MLSVKPLQKTVEAVLLTPYIAGEKPLSLLIVAKPESGKTSVMKMYRETKGIIYVTDATAYGIQRDILPKFVSGESKTLIIADLLTPLSKSTKTRMAFVAFLNNLIEEGVAKITTYATVWDKEVRANVITSVTEEAMIDGRHDWAKMGFLSRFIIFSYSYPMSTVHKILDLYSNNSYSDITSRTVDGTGFQLPDSEIDVVLPEKIAGKLDPIATEIGYSMGLYGIRAKISLRSLLKAIAYRNKRTTVCDRDFNELLELADHMNFDYNCM